MKTEELWRWRIQWIGKWSTTRYHASEAQIRKEHPEAVRVEGTLIKQQIPETSAEVLRAMYRPKSTGDAPLH